MPRILIQSTCIFRIKKIQPPYPSRLKCLKCILNLPTIFGFWLAFDPVNVKGSLLGVTPKCSFKKKKNNKKKQLLHNVMSCRLKSLAYLGRYLANLESIIQSSRAFAPPSKKKKKMELVAGGSFSLQIIKTKQRI